MEKTFKYAPFVLIAITIAVFFPTFFNDFQRGWDDQWAVLDYEYVVNHSLNDLTYHFTHFHLGQYMPVNTLLYIDIYKLFGFDPSAFHAAGLIIHAYLSVMQIIVFMVPIFEMFIVGVPTRCLMFIYN